MERNFELSPSTYEWSVRLFSIVKRMLKVNIKLHHSDGLIAAGEIFLFNHFARFETFIPQYLIYQETGAFCRSVAGHEFFAEGDAFSNYLVSLGAVPNNHPRLLPFLAAEVLRGRKVVLFPEGGMVKDRRVIDANGEYNIYSRSAEERRKHHSGAAVLATGLEAFKTTLLREHAAGHTRHLEEWAERLELSDVDALLVAARRPTMIVPASITFYPMRVNGNLLHKGAELINRGIARRLSEELLIEGNILLKDTDMDIRLDQPVRPSDEWRWWEHKLMTRVVRHIDGLDDFFALSRARSGWAERVFARGMRRRILRIRDRYMHRMYEGVTVNLSHIASSIILRLLDRNDAEIDEIDFHRMVYLAVKNVQKESTVHLHRSLRNPESYGGILEGQCVGLQQFIFSASNMGLVEHAGGRYRFLPKLLVEHEFDEIRLENLIAVYANEVGPITEVAHAVDDALKRVESLDERAVARLRFDDERIAYAWDRWYYSKPRYAEVNRLETATESGEPFVFAVDPRAVREPAPLAVVLVHGFLASPAEVRDFGERLAERGYPVIGVRLKGHGTSPCDLRERTWDDWLTSVRRAYAIVSAFAERTCLVGFSTGGALSLRLAAERPPGLAGVVGINVPVRFRNRNMVFVPLMHGANRFVRSVSSLEGVMPFRPNQSEHPEINYRQMPIRALYELRLLVDDMQKWLPRVRCPVRLVQGDRDPVVDPKSAENVLAKLGSENKRLLSASAERHGILNENIDGTHASIFSFLDEFRPEEAVARELVSSSVKAPI
ncbi:MAG: alpha/beta fold hydrolase [Gammaproteobacteria bacterium]|nr:alpha/beta fold hydrolase [Gammaproteobacteria bacterium]